jgi:hypothetical protein
MEEEVTAQISVIEPFTRQGLVSAAGKFDILKI